MKKFNLDIETILRSLVVNLENKGLDVLYGEHINGDMCFITDWNHKSIPNNLEAWLRSKNIRTMYNDEYVICSHCYKIVDSQHHSYSDELEFQMIGNDYAEPICINCLKENPEWLFDDCLNNSDKCVKQSFIPEQFLIDKGFRKYNELEYESGLHPGMNDNPSDIIKKLNKEFKYHYDYIFRLTSVSQFCVRFDLWIKEN